MKKNPSAPTYQLKPITHHIDGGFGALGDAFHESATRLEKSIQSRKFFKMGDGA